MSNFFCKKATVGLLCVITSASMLMGCQSKGSEEAQTVIQEETVPQTEASGATEKQTEMPIEMPTEEAVMDKEEKFMGEITAIDENSITVALYEMPQDTGEKPEGEAPAGEKPEGGAPAGEKPEGGAPAGEKPEGEAPMGEKPEGGAPEEKSEMEFTLSGEEMTITITDDTVITRINEDTKETLLFEDLAVEDVVTFTLDGENAQTIEVR